MDTFVERPDFEGDPQFALEQEPLFEETEEEPEELGFDPAVQQDFYGLTLVGYLEDSFPLYGHNIRIRTLKSGEEIAVSLVTKEYEGTMGQGMAGYIAGVAACLVTIDGHEPPKSLSSGNDVRETIGQRFDWVKENLDFHTVVSPIYEAYMRLNARKIEVAQELQSKSLKSRNS